MENEVNQLLIFYPRLKKYLFNCPSNRANWCDLTAKVPLYLRIYGAI